MASDSQKVYRWGIIGCGKISSDFCNVLSVYDRAKIVACAARKLVGARDFARKYEIDSYYDDYAQLAKDDRVDIVYVGTIHPAHVSNVLLCLEYGKHVLCEKPMGVNYSETKAMIDCGMRIAHELVTVQCNVILYNPQREGIDGFYWKEYGLDIFQQFNNVKNG